MNRKTLRLFLRKKSAIAGGVILAGLVGMALYSLLIGPPPNGEFATAPSGAHLFGTDTLGRDQLWRITAGAQVSLFIGFISVGLALGLGVLIGLTAGYSGGKTDLMLMRLVDFMLSFPAILLAILIVVMFHDPGLKAAMIAVGLVEVPVFARLIRSVALSEKEKDYIQAARALGLSPTAIALKHLLPNLLGPLIVQATLGFGTAILDAAGLSFIGLGAQEPLAEWGFMLKAGKELITSAWWLVTFPGLAIFLAVLGFNLLGDGLREVLDPRRRLRG
jgi:peptide/nickel transport system permease protein